LINKKDIDEKIEKIIDYFDSPDIKPRANALDAYNDLLLNENLTNSQKRIIIPYLEEILKDTGSPLRTNVFKIATLICIKKFNLMETIFPILLDELKIKNRFRTKIVISMLYELRNSDQPLIEDAIIQIIKFTPIWFEESYLMPIIEEFWQKSTEQSFQFITKYLDTIKLEIPNYPEKFNNLKDFIFQKLEDYNNYLIEINKKKEEEKKLKQEIEAKRKEMMEKEKLRKIEKEKEKIKMREKLENFVKSFSEQKDVISTSMDKENINGSSLKEELVKDIDDDIGAETISEIKDSDDSTSFTTFTSLGLKRKKLDEEN